MPRRRKRTSGFWSAYSNRRQLDNNVEESNGASRSHRPRCDRVDDTSGRSNRPGHGSLSESSPPSSSGIPPAADDASCYSEGRPTPSIHIKSKSRNRSRRRNRTFQQRNVNDSINTAVAASASSADAAQERSHEIPGFHYDPQTKRYFRLLPGHNNFNPLTSATIKTKAMQNSLLNPETVARSVTKSSAALIAERKTGRIGGASFERQIAEGRVSNMRLVKKQHALSGSMEYMHHQTGETTMDILDGCSFLVTYPGQPGAVGIWPLDYDLVPNAKRIGALTVESKKVWTEDDDSECKLNIMASDSPLWHFHGKVADVCWADMENGIFCILFCCVGNMAVSSNAMMMALFDFCPAEEESYYLNGFHCDLNLGSGAVWSCAWNRYTQSAAFGLEGRTQVANIDIFEIEEVFTKQQNPLSVKFNSPGWGIFSGTNKRELLFTDMRENFLDRCTYSIHEAAPISCMHLMESEKSVIVSGFDNLLSMVDLRMRKSVLTYPEHNNSYMKLLLSAEENENVLCSVGQDGFTRLWRLSDASLLNTIPPVTPVINPCDVPSVCYRSAWNQNSTSQGLIMATKNEVLLYQP